MDRKINMRYELARLRMESCMSGCRMELLDLLDYATQHNGVVGIEHLKEEITSLRDMEASVLDEWLKGIGEKFDEDTIRWNEAHPKEAK